VSSRYLDMMRGQRRSNTSFQFTSKTLLVVLALIAMGGSAVYWWGVQHLLTQDTAVAIRLVVILVLTESNSFSTSILWSLDGMLLQKVNADAWDYGTARHLVSILSHEPLRSKHRCNSVVSLLYDVQS
jgi:hypothetical protein